MDILCEPRSDERLCSAVYAGNVLSIKQAIEELQGAGCPMMLSRAMVISISKRNISALLLLLSYGEVEEEVAEAAAASESIQLVQVILDHGWAIDRALRGGSIPSILSLATRNAEFLGGLLSLGADPNQDSNLGETALSFAIREGTIKVIQTLLAAGADVTRGDLLHCASHREASEDTYDLVAMLTQQGVPVDTYQWDNERAKMMRYGYPQGTALHVACTQQNYIAAEALLGFGADPCRLKKREDHLVPPSPYEITTPRSALRSLLEGYMHG